MCSASPTCTFRIQMPICTLLDSCRVERVQVGVIKFQKVFAKPRAIGALKPNCVIEIVLKN